MFFIDLLGMLSITFLIYGLIDCLMGFPYTFYLEAFIAWFGFFTGINPSLTWHGLIFFTSLLVEWIIWKYGGTR